MYEDEEYEEEIFLHKKDESYWSESKLVET